MNRKIRIQFTDFPGPANIDALTVILDSFTNIEIVKSRPDFLFYSIFGNNHLHSEAPVKIFFTGENVHPDFNLCDYAFGFDWLEFEDRYFRCPNFILYPEYQRIYETAADLGEFFNRPRFCNFIYSNSGAHPFRDRFFHALNNKIPVDSAGLHLNNTGEFRGSPRLGKHGTEDKLQFQSECKFTIAFENSSNPGYTTEKIVHAFISGTIPIYWGDPVVTRQFNPKRFIEIPPDLPVERAIDKVLSVANNKSLQAAMLSESIFASQEAESQLSKDTLAVNLQHILDQPTNIAPRRNRFVWGEKYYANRQAETEPVSRPARMLDALIKLSRAFLS